MSRIEKRVSAFVMILVMAISVIGVILIYMMQGTPMMARTRVPEKSGSLLPYVKEEKKNSSALDRLHEIELTVPPGHTSDDITVKALEFYKGYEIRIRNISQSYFVDYPIAGNGRDIDDLSYDMSGNTAVITMTMDEPMFLIRSQGSGRVYFDLKGIREYFDRIVVVDAGHGGKDCGAKYGGKYEKDITLSIVKKIKKLTGTDRIKETESYASNVSAIDVKGVGRVGIFYTRLDDRKVFLKERRAFADAFSPDLLLSVHINSTATGRESSIHGSQVLYRAGDRSGKSKQFAQIVADRMHKYLGTRDRGAIAGDEMYLIRTSEEPVALAEIGFITSPSEFRKLITDSYQEKAAEALVDAITSYLQK